MMTYLGVLDGQWRWLGKLPRTFASSPGVERSFCDTCGSPMTFRSKTMSGIMHFYVAALDDPEVLTPTLHAAHEEKLPWLTLGDGLPTCVGPDYTKA